MISQELLLSWGAALKRYASEEIIFTEGTEARFYYQIKSGNVKRINVNDSGIEYIHFIHGDGDCFGELPLFDDEPYMASAIAESDCEVLRLQKETFMRLLQENPTILLSFTKLISQHLRFKFLITKETALYDPEHTILSLFDYFKKRKKFFKSDNNRLHLTRQQIAGITGLRIETVIRTIRSMYKSGLLQIEKGHIFLNYDLSHKY